MVSWQVTVGGSPVYVVDKRLGKGGFGQVYLGKRLPRRNVPASRASPVCHCTAACSCRAGLNALPLPQDLLIARRRSVSAMHGLLHMNVLSIMLILELIKAHGCRGCLSFSWPSASSNLEIQMRALWLLLYWEANA